ncbi:MAG: DUF4251 domain-containing protein [Bacteroidales bacterium]|nr:DUF4251 domain-containing protein [Bacteroidales bacterium]
MKKLGIILISVITAIQAYPQEEQSVDRKTARQLEREQRKHLEEINAEATAQLVDSLVNNRNFIIKANYLGDQTGMRIIVDEKINFIMVDSTDITIQYGSMNNAMLGYNGLGGITTEGTITRFDVSKTGRNKDSYSIQIHAMTSIGSYDVFIYISQDGYATATIGSNTRGKLIYYGDVFPLEGSRIYKGSTI